VKPINHLDLKAQEALFNGDYCTHDKLYKQIREIEKGSEEMSKFVKLSIPSVTPEQKAYLDEIKDRVGIPVNATIRKLIQKAMDEAEVQLRVN
jgi:hypothetical protein